LAIIMTIITCTVLCTWHLVKNRRDRKDINEAENEGQPEGPELSPLLVEEDSPTELEQPAPLSILHPTPEQIYENNAENVKKYKKQITDRDLPVMPSPPCLTSFMPIPAPEEPDSLRSIGKGVHTYTEIDLEFQNL